MKLKYSLFSRRAFLNWLIGGGLAALGAALISPVLKFIIPPYKEPDEVKLPASDLDGLTGNRAVTFAWGNKPGLLKRGDDGALQAFVAVCTHLDCNVTWLPDDNKFYCACHQGWYSSDGVNIAGPPPRPLRRLSADLENGDIVIRKEA